MEELTPLERSALEPPSPVAEALSPDAPAGREPLEGDPRRSPDTNWPPWVAPLGLIAGLVLAALGGLAVDLPALAFGVKLSSAHVPPGLSIADTVVQDLAFVLAAVYCAHLGGRVVRAWQFGLRSPGDGWGRAALLIGGLYLSFLLLSVVWSALLHPSEDKLLEQLGSNEATSLLLLSAVLTCVVAPICEEFLFRGLIFTALRNWRGTLPAAVITGLVFGGVHIGSAPTLDLVPLAGLGFGLCLLYRRSGSLYPCIAAHSLNNSIAFSSLEGWSWQAPILIVGALAAIGAIVLACKRAGLIAPTPGFVSPSA